MDTPSRLIVIDGPNVAMDHGLHEEPSWTGLKVVIEYWKRRGYTVVTFVPRYFEHRQSPSQQTLLDLHKARDVSFTPASDADDLYIIQYAFERGGFVISNDLFRDHARTLTPGPEREAFRSWVAAHVISYSFVGDEFVPNPAQLSKLPPPINPPSAAGPYADTAFRAQNASDSMAHHADDAMDEDDAHIHAVPGHMETGAHHPTTNRAEMYKTGPGVPAADSPTDRFALLQRLRESAPMPELPSVADLAGHSHQSPAAERFFSPEKRLPSTKTVSVLDPHLALDEAGRLEQLEPHVCAEIIEGMQQQVSSALQHIHEARPDVAEQVNSRIQEIVEDVHRIVRVAARMWLRRRQARTDSGSGAGVADKDLAQSIQVLRWAWELIAGHMGAFADDVRGAAGADASATAPRFWSKEREAAITAEAEAYVGLYFPQLTPGARLLPSD